MYEKCLLFTFRYSFKGKCLNWIANWLNDDTKFENGKRNIYLVISLLCGVLRIKRSVVVDSLLDVSPSGKK